MAPAGKVRTIRIADVVKALEIVAERLGEAGSCDTLQAWAGERRVTPSGQQLTPEAVRKGIEIWRAQKDLPRDAKRAAAAQPPADHDAAAAHEADAAKRRKLSYADRAKERKEHEAKLVEMTQARFREVLAEIQGHMEEVLRRQSPEALEEFRRAPDGDRRELFTRLVHREQELEASPPEALSAELLSHQVEGLEWLASLYVNRLHGILADEMGLGKTIQSIALLLYIKERRGSSGPHLIVAPKSCLGNWQNEFKRFAPAVAVHVLTGDQEQRDAELAAFQRSLRRGSEVVVCVTNYEQVHRNDFLAKRDWQLVIVDEGHRLKNPETLLHATMARLRCRMRLLLTGTPLQNSLTELWALLHYLLPDLFTHMIDFKAWFASPFKGSGMNEFDVQLNPEQEQQVCAQTQALLAPFLLQRLNAEVLGGSLPPRVEVTVRVPLSAWQHSAYKDLEKRTLKLLEGEDVSSEQVNNALMQLRKIVLHPYLFQKSYPKDADLFRTSGKVEALDRLLTKLLRHGHKVLIFSQFTSVLDVLQDYLEWKKMTFVRIDGQVGYAERLARLKRFELPEVSVFLLSSRAGGLGLNLQAADTVVLFDLDWNPQNDKQAIARVHRVGQTREVRVVRLLSDSPVERHMEQRCSEKLQLEEKILGAGMFRQATPEQRRGALRAVLGLEAADGASADSPAAEATALTSAEELNDKLARSDEERRAFAAWDAEVLRPRRLVPQELKEAPLLVRCGRLMRPSEVPPGFTCTRTS